MLALLLGLAAAVGWVVFDVVAAVVTYPNMTTGWWWIFVSAGGVLVTLTAVAQIIEYKAHQRDEMRHSQEHDVLAQGSIAILAKMIGAIGQPTDTVIEAATTKLALLENKLSRIEERSWIALDIDRKEILASKLGVFRGHSVQVVAHENPDCQELAEDIKDCFRKAEWHVRKVPLTGSWATSGASGLIVTGWEHTETLCRATADALMDVMRASVTTTIDMRPHQIFESDMPEIIVVVGTKKVR